MNLEKLRSQLKRLNEQKDAWYTIASQKFSDGDKDGQAKAYAEIDAIQIKIDNLVSEINKNDELLDENDGIL